MISIYPTSVDSKNIKGKNIDSKKRGKSKCQMIKRSKKNNLVFSLSLVIYAFSISLLNIFTFNIATNFFLTLTFQYFHFSMKAG
jgi:hypothetical protein